MASTLENKTGMTYQQWWDGVLASNATLQNNVVLRDFLKTFLDQIQAYHEQNGNQVLYCRGQKRFLVSSSSLACDIQSCKTTVYAQWFDFVQIAANSRHSGPVIPNIEQGKEEGHCRRRFETLSIKVQASRARSKFGMTDDTGYLFPCLQHYIPRACFLVMDHTAHGNEVFIIHGTKKFAGQGDDGTEEGTAPVAVASSHNNTNTTSLHNPPPKCFPETEHLSPTHYIFTWKANGKNAGVFGYTDPNYNDQTWLFVNSKGVCECAGLLDEIAEDITKNTFSDGAEGSFLPDILHGFLDIWNHHDDVYMNVNQAKIHSLWWSGYLIFFELCDNKHIVLERGPRNRPVDHLAFIGLIQQPPNGSIDTYNAGLVFRQNNNDSNLFSFELWKHQVQAPAFSCKPSVYVRVEHLEQAMRSLMQGTFFRGCPSHSSSTGGNNEATVWYDPAQSPTDGESSTILCTGEGAVCYEMAQHEKGCTVIRQLFKAKTASYITHRQFRGFLSRVKSGEDHYLESFEAFHLQVKHFCRRKFGDLNPHSPYPDLKTFCSAPTSVIVEAASLFYAHFGMWLHNMASNLKSTVAAMVGVMNSDFLVPLDSDLGKAYRKTAAQLGLADEDVTVESDLQREKCVAIRCGMAFRIAEFSALFELEHSKVFANPYKILEQLHSLEKSRGCFPWMNVPRGYNGFIMVGSSHAFPDGMPSHRAVDGENKNKKKKKKKQPATAPVEPFQKAFRSFLLANPDVKLTIGSMYPTRFVFTTFPERETLVSSPAVEEFSVALRKLPNLDRSEDSTHDNKKVRALTEDEAVTQAIATLEKAFPTLSALFDCAVDLRFGHVFGRLVPISSHIADTCNKHMLIIRGFPGLGKSSIAKALRNIWGHNMVAIIEADDFFGPGCPFDPELLPTAHEDAQLRALEALRDPVIQLVVVSNTNTTAREYANYIRIANDTKQPAVAILTLDTTTPLEEVDNIHDVPLEKVKQMAFRLRHPDNNPEGKKLDDIFAIADKQVANYRTIPGPILVWNQIGADGHAVLEKIWLDFIRFATANGISIPSTIIRPSHPHATQLFLRPSSPKEDFSRLAQIWDYHDQEQMVEIAEVRYSVRTSNCGGGTSAPLQTGSSDSVLVNLAIQVVSFTPNINDKESPHITIAYDPDHASAVDSNKLWQSADGTDKKQDQFHNNCVVKTFEGYEPCCKHISGTIQAGIFQSHQLIHKMPKWAKT